MFFLLGRFRCGDLDGAGWVDEFFFVWDAKIFAKSDETSVQKSKSHQARMGDSICCLLVLFDYERASPVSEKDIPLRYCA